MNPLDRVRRVGATAQNLLEVARFGGLETGEEPAPYEVAARGRIHRLRRYGDGDGATPPLLLVPPLMLTAEVYDVSPNASAVTVLREHGTDPWVIDFGSPEQEPGGARRTLADHVLAVSDAVDHIREATGRDVHLVGYSQGGMFCYQAAAYRRNAGVASIVVFGSPVDLRSSTPLGLPEEIAVPGAGLVQQVLGGRSVPGWATRTGFRMLDPIGAVRSQAQFLLALNDRDALLPREGQRRFLMEKGWVAWPGAALADFLQEFVQHNRMLVGGFEIAGRAVSLADIDLPILCVVGEVDDIAPPDSVRAIARAAPHAKVCELSLPTGHFGLVVGRSASARSWPVVAGWAEWRDGSGARPDGVGPLTETATGDGDAGLTDRLRYAADLAAAGAVRTVQDAAGVAARSVATVRDIATGPAAQLPLLTRVGRMSAGTRTSLGRLLAEQARKHPDHVGFLFDDHVYRAKEIDERVERVARGLLRLGIRRGDHVGVLMGTRPTAVAVIAALNRIGAVGVLLRPDDPTREAELGEVTRVIVDPAHEPAFAGAELPVHAFLLAGGAEAERVPDAVGDLEALAGDSDATPSWYEPDPGRAEDLAFVMFTGHGERTRPVRITNGRFMLAALGTASAAALTSDDTVFTVSPLHHPAGLMTSVGGALAGGARIAMASAFEPTAFWDEARRYGVTVVSYTWAQLDELLDAPVQTSERHHQIRLFMGSGIPRSTWRAVVERFAPARVLEFWASTEGEAILVNVSGAKLGAAGRRLPGSAELRLARYDVEEGRLVQGPDGLGVPCETGEAGMLLARAGDRSQATVSPVRDVFAHDDAWVSTGSLFVRDDDGDHWLVDAVGALIETAEGAVSPTAIANALSTLDAVALPVVYGLKGSAKNDVAVAAVKLRASARLTAKDLLDVFRDAPAEQRPTVVHVVDTIPMTTAYRPRPDLLRAAGVRPGRRAWVFDPDRRRYRLLDEDTLDRLTGGSAPRPGSSAA
jgi:putative long chain acyl-CoA synthase